MTTQAIPYLPVLDPSRGAFWALWAPLTVVALVALAALVDHLAEPRRNPTDVMAVYSLRTARRALARVDRLDIEDSAAGAAAYRHLSAAGVWLRAERHYGGRRRRRQAAIGALLADVGGRLAALGYDPETGRPAMRQVEPRDGLPVVDRWADALETRPAPEGTARYRDALEAAGVPAEVAARADIYRIEPRFEPPNLVAP